MGKQYILTIILAGFISAEASAKKITNKFKSEGMSVGVEVLSDRFDVPWGFDFINDSQLIISERKGTMSLLDIKSGMIKTVKGLPKVYHGGQGGLLDVAVHPNFSKTKLIYFTYAIDFEDGHTTRLGMAKLKGQYLANFKVLFTALPSGNRSIHFGSRIAFDKKGHIYFSVGDRGKRDRAQDLKTHSGKIIRLNLDGSVPKDNPFVNRKGVKKEIWTYGHRNPQGLTRHPITGQIWEQEHGPRGGDEINLLRKGYNYGWPIITYGKEYWGPSIGTTHKKGLVQPVYHYTPSIAPSGLAIYAGSKFPAWQGNVFSGALKLTHINRLVLGKTNRVLKEERLLKGMDERIRNIKVALDGLIYFSSDSGKIMRLVPVN